jgi:hypothetical protein
MSLQQRQDDVREESLPRPSVHPQEPISPSRGMLSHLSRHTRSHERAEKLQPSSSIHLGRTKVQHRQVHELHVPKRDFDLSKVCVPGPGLRPRLTEICSRQLLQAVHHARRSEDAVQPRRKILRGKFHFSHQMRIKRSKLFFAR